MNVFPGTENAGESPAMRDTYDVILAVVVALGLGVFWGMPLG
ncbi:hypothetical protein [Armatimonas sp.]